MSKIFSIIIYMSQCVNLQLKRLLKFSECQCLLLLVLSAYRELLAGNILAKGFTALVSNLKIYLVITEQSVIVPFSLNNAICLDTCKNKILSGAANFSPQTRTH